MDKQKQQEAYKNYVKQKTPVHNLPLNMLKAFITGGIICTIGQGILNYCRHLGIEKDISAGWTSMILILLSVLLTGFNIYPRSQNGVAQERWFRLPDLRTPWRHRQSNIRKKDRSWESAARYLP